VLELIRQFVVAQKTGVIGAPIMPIDILCGRDSGVPFASSPTTAQPSTNHG